MKWIRRILIALAVLAGGLVAAALLTALRTENPVGFQVVRATGADGKSFPVAVWYPTDARPRPTTLLGPLLMDVAADGPIRGQHLPLVVISHGNGGGPGSHADLALGLANAGSVAAALMHAGDNYSDQSAVGSASWLSDRNQQLGATVDHMLGTWQGRDRIDPQRVGAFGFSAGGFTVLTAIGAQPDLRIIGYLLPRAAILLLPLALWLGSWLVEAVRLPGCSYRPCTSWRSACQFCCWSMWASAKSPLARRSASGVCLPAGRSWRRS